MMSSPQKSSHHNGPEKNTWKRYTIIVLLLVFGLFTALWLDNILQALLYGAFTRPQSYSFSDWMHVALRLALAWGVAIILLLPILLIAKLKMLVNSKKQN